MPAVPGAVGAELFVLERDGELHAVPAAAVALTPRPALDGSRRLAQVEWEPSPATLVVSGFEAEEFLAALGDRAAMAHGGGVGGGGRPADRHGRALRPGAGRSSESRSGPSRR